MQFTASQKLKLPKVLTSNSCRGTFCSRRPLIMRTTVLSLGPVYWPSGTTFTRGKEVNSSSVMIGPSEGKQNQQFILLYIILYNILYKKYNGDEGRASIFPFRSTPSSPLHVSKSWKLLYHMYFIISLQSCSKSFSPPLDLKFMVSMGSSSLPHVISSSSGCPALICR